MFYGVEDGQDDEFFTPRFMGSLIKQPSHIDYGLFGADVSDEFGIDSVASAIDFYATKSAFYYNLHLAICENSPTCWSDTYNIGRAYLDGALWFNTLDPTWQELTGATQTNIVSLGSCTCYFEGNFGNEEIPICTEPCVTIDCQLCDWIEEELHVIVTQHESDGFILSESAMNGPGATPGIPVTEMYGSGHMQMKNDSNMELAVDAIFGGDIHPFFYTEERE